MNIAKLSTLLLLGVALSLGVTGCKKTPHSPTPIFPTSRSAPGGANVPGGLIEPGSAVPANNEPRVSPLKTDEGTALGARPGDLSNYLQDRDTFKQDTVYFEFDKYNLKPGELTKVQTVANYLKGQSTDAVLVEGHCDERGTPEYNRSLGERRALSIRESLVTLGVPAERIHTVSFGEDKPADTGHNEAAWIKNRRGEFVLLKPKAGAGAGDNR